MERIDKIIASQGLYSRSDVKYLVKHKRVVALYTGSVVVPATSATMETSCPVKALINEDFPLFVFPNTPICRRFADGVSFHVAPICVLLLVRFAESVIISTVYDHFVSDTFHAARHTVPALCRLISRTDFIII